MTPKVVTTASLTTAFHRILHQHGDLWEPTDGCGCDQWAEALWQGLPDSKVESPNGGTVPLRYDGENWVEGHALDAGPLCGHYIPVEECPVGCRVRVWIEYTEDSAS